MAKRDITKVFIDEIYCELTIRSYPNNKTVYNHVDEIWSFDLADFSDYKISNNKGYRYIFVIIDNFSKCSWCVPLKN